VTPHHRAAPPEAEPAPELPAGASLVALVPAIADLDLAAAAAWEFARRLANAGRRVALIDCYVDAPRLHAVAGESNEDGIVDVFDYGASLSRIARAQPEGSLFFVPAGTFSPDPAGMMARPRWRRLSAGFRHEDAVMLLFLPPECIGALASEVDGLVPLAPGQPGTDLAGSPEIRAALDRGTRLLPTFCGTADAAPSASEPVPPEPPEEPVAIIAAPDPDVMEAPSVAFELPPAVMAESADSGASPESRGTDIPPAASELPPGLAAGPAARPRRQPVDDLDVPLDWTLPKPEPPRRPLAAYALLLVLAAAAATYAYRRQLGWGEARDAAPPEPAARVSPAYRTLAPHAADSLPFAVQVAAWTSFPQALEDADTIEGRGFQPIVAPLRLQRTVWYRIYVGPVASRRAADSLLHAVRVAGLDGSRAAAVALVPLSFALRRVVTALAARTARDRLRSAGLAAFVLGQADGSYRLFAGAFDTPDQAAYLDSLLTSTGSAGPLGPRVGFHP
jgi:hypothetical protein